MDKFSGKIEQVSTTLGMFAEKPRNYNWDCLHLCYCIYRLYYEDGHRISIKGRTWKYFEDYLIWSSESAFFQYDNELWSVFVPMNTTEEIMVGKFNQISGLADELHSAEVKITSSENDCFMVLKIKFLEKKDFKISFMKHKRRIPLIRYKTEPLCKVSKAKTPSKQFLEWDEFMANTSVENESPENSFEVLSYLKPETSKVDFSQKPKKFITKIKGNCLDFTIYTYKSVRFV